MARRIYFVQHFVACTEITVERAGPSNPYTLRDVRYVFDVPPDREWPVRLDGLWLFVRFMNLDRRRRFYIRLVWMDAPSGDREVGVFPSWVVRPSRDGPTADRSWRLDAVRFPAAGRYRFELYTERGHHLLASEYIFVRRLP